MSDLLFLIVMIFFYSVPFIVFFLSNWMNQEIRSLGLNIKTIDILTPYLVFSIHIYSSLAYDFSLIPYFIIVISLVGIALACFLAFKKKELYYRKFFRIWWRYVFLLSFITYIIIGGIAVYYQF